MSRKFRYENGQVVEVAPEPVRETEKPLVSDSLGFTEHQYQEMEADRQRHSFKQIEFVRDPDVPQFFQVKCGSREEFNRYMKHRGFCDRNSRNGSTGAVGAREIQRAEEEARKRYPSKKK